MLLRNAPAILAIGLVLATGWFHGLRTNRWKDAPELNTASRYLPNIPKRIGSWVGEDTPQTENQLRAFVLAELRVAVVRTYTNENSGQRIQIMAVCGPPGPIGTHTPEACYSGAGFNMKNHPAPIEFPRAGKTPGTSDTFWVADFRDDRKVSPTGLKIYWSFRPPGPDARWEASPAPRGEFALHTALYKIYVIRPMVMMGPSPVEDDVTPDFIRELLPAIEQSVFEAQKAGGQPATSVSMLP
jgi:hypothetical protein